MAAELNKFCLPYQLPSILSVPFPLVVDFKAQKKQRRQLLFFLICKNYLNAHNMQAGIQVLVLGSWSYHNLKHCWSVSCIFISPFKIKTRELRAHPLLYFVGSRSRWSVHTTSNKKSRSWIQIRQGGLLWSWVVVFAMDGAHVSEATHKSGINKLLWWYGQGDFFAQTTRQQ